MIAGLPGTGVGGIFYFILAAAMPVFEFFKTLRGKSDFRRWAFIALQLTFVVWIVVGIWAEVWCLNHLLTWVHNALSANGTSHVTSRTHAYLTTRALTYASAFGSLITLAVLFASVHLLRLRFSSRKAPAQIVRGLG
jgi:hypothetical protein